MQVTLLYSQRSMVNARKGIILAGGAQTRLYPHDARAQQAAGARLQQAARLLPTVHSDAGRRPRDARDRPEEIAFRMGWIGVADVERIAKPMRDKAPTGNICCACWRVSRDRVLS
jgi:hypothetical protein